MKQNLGYDKLVQWKLFWSNLFNSHVGNHFFDIFVPLCYVDYFIDANELNLPYNYYLPYILLESFEKA